MRFLPQRLELPTPLPFAGVEFYPRQSMRYTSTMNVQKIVRAANKDLAINDPEAYKAFLLCFIAGQRRNEADKQRWSSFDFKRAVIRVEVHDSFAPKAETSLSEIPLDKDVCAILRRLRKTESNAEFVLAGNPPRNGLKWRPYRAEATFSRLLTWLRSKGVNTRNPIHTLRKEAGSLICQSNGLFAASRFLRHADVGITAQHYADQKERVTVKLNSLLAKDSPANVVEFNPNNNTDASEA